MCRRHSATTHLGDRPQFHPTRHVLTDDAIAFVESNRDKPFAMCLMFREPHLPYGPMPKEDTDAVAELDPTIPDVPALDAKQVKNWTRKYYAAIHAADRNLGRLLRKLDELKLADHTIVLFTSDHGYCIGQHTVHAKGNGTWIAGGVAGPRRPNMFEENVRVPLIIRWPGVVKPGTEIADMVTNLDTFATVLGMLGIRSGDEGENGDVGKQHGVDFSPLLRGGGGQMPKRDAIFGQYDMHNGGFASMRMIRTDRWKLVRYQLTNGQNELFDLQSDPGESKNLYGDPAAKQVRDELWARLTEWQKSIDDPILRNPLNTPGVQGAADAN